VVDFEGGSDRAGGIRKDKAVFMRVLYCNKKPEAPGVGWWLMVWYGTAIYANKF